MEKMGRRLAVSAKLARHAPGEALGRTGPEVVRRIALAMVDQDSQAPPPQVVGLVRMREPILAAVTWWMAGVWGLGLLPNEYGYGAEMLSGFFAQSAGFGGGGCGAGSLPTVEAYVGGGGGGQGRGGVGAVIVERVG